MVGGQRVSFATVGHTIPHGGGLHVSFETVGHKIPCGKGLTMRFQIVSHVNSCVCLGGDGAAAYKFSNSSNHAGSCGGV